MHVVIKVDQTIRTQTRKVFPEQFQIELTKHSLFQLLSFCGVTSGTTSFEMEVIWSSSLNKAFRVWCFHWQTAPEETQNAKKELEFAWFSFLFSVSLTAVSTCN